MAHQNYERRYDKIFQKVVDMALERLDPEEREMRREMKIQKQVEKKLSPQQTLLSELTPTSEQKSPPRNEHSRNRHIPQSIRDKVWVRDHGECQYQDPKTGRVCGSKHGVQLDHIKPYSAGGEHTPQNLRLLCGPHNQHRNVAGCFD